MSNHILVVAEKPSVAQSIAKALGVFDRKDGYIEGNGYIVSWCIGHLVALADADMYNEKYKKWSLDTLPIIPSEWQYIVSADKNKQFNILKKLMNSKDVDEIVCATDAGREGELIFRLVYNQAECKKPFKRLWISSMEESAIQNGFKNLKNGTDYDNLYQSALCRAKADWIIGINATRLFSRLYNRTLNVGRVQTPTLAMLYERENSIGSFKKEKYFNVHLKADGLDAVLEKVKEQSEAEKIKSDCNGRNANVISVKREQKTVNAPRLYDLTTLQREANRLYGFTAQQTLDYTQSLYEMKLVTYPRTDSQFLTDDMGDTAAEIIGIVLDKIPHFSSYSLTPDVPKVLNSKKVSDHHAIIPTAELGSIRLDEVPDGEKKILFLIANKLLCATSEKYVYETVTAEINCSGYSFTTRGRNNVYDGWKAVEQRFKSYQKCKDDDEEEAVSLAFTEGDSFTVTSDVSEHFTQPPKHFTEDTLLSAMERAGQRDVAPNSDFVGDTLQPERTGLGTPATRASIIEKLTKSGFIKREKKNIIVTDSGKDLISVMPDIVKSATLTAEWENSLSLMAQGKFTSEQFMADIGKLTNDIISVAKSNVDESKVTAKSGSEVIGVCPRCKKNIIETPKAYSCEDRSCGFVLWKDNKFFQSAKKAFTKEMAKALIKDGKIAVKGLYSQKSGRNYDATVCLDDTGTYVNFKLEFAPRKVTKKK